MGSSSRGGGLLSCFHTITCMTFCILVMCHSALQAAAFFDAPPCQRQIIQNCALFSISSEFGAVSASSSHPRLDPLLIEAARVRLPWEEKRENDNNEVACLSEEISSGQQWYQTRQVLTTLWVLPRDMSNGSWEAYAIAANNGEDRLLSCVPQLLRLPPDDIERSAKTVLSVLKLPPALLRREPLLLTVPSDLLVKGFEQLLSDEREDVTLEGIDEEIRLNVLEACKDTSGLLLEAATNDSRRPILS